MNKNSRNKIEFKYELISLFHELGHELVINYFKYKYTKYLEDNNIKIVYFMLLRCYAASLLRCFAATLLRCYAASHAHKNHRPTIITDDGSRSKDFLSYVEFKNKLILDEQYYLDTTDLVEYGRDMYLFTIFNTYLFKSSQHKSNKIDLKNTIRNKVIKSSSSITSPKVNSKELITRDYISYNSGFSSSHNIFKINTATLGHFYPSRSRINQVIS